MPENDPIKTFRRSLGAHIDALVAALTGLRDKEPDALENLRDRARTIYEQASELGREAVLEIATKLGTAPPPDVPKYTGALIDVLRKEAGADLPHRASVLIIGGHDDANRNLVATLDAQGYPSVLAANAKDARLQLRDRYVACIVLRSVLPDIDGRTFLERLHETPATAAIPIMVVGGHIDETVKENSMLNASDAYVDEQAGIDPIVDWVRARFRRAAESAKPARRDTLTGLLNRAAFRESFERIQQERANTKDPLTFASLSLAAGKEVLEALDPEERENVLQEFGLRLSNSLRATDVVGRWGAFEFVVLFIGEGQPGAERAIEKIVTQMREQPLETASGEPLQVALSAGVTNVGDNDTIDNAIAETDHYVYEAATQGGNRVVGERPVQPVTRPPRILLLVHDTVTAHVLRQLLEKDQFEVEAFTHWDAKAADAFVRTPYHLVVIDQGLPPDGGIEALKDLRQDTRNPRLPIMMLISSNNEEAVSQAMENGANDYIIRPFSPGTFVNRAHRLLSRGTTGAVSTACRILIVSDDVKSMILAASALHQRGEFDVLLARGNQNGLERLHADAPEVVLLDTAKGDGGKAFFDALAGRPLRAPVSVIVASEPLPKDADAPVYPNVVKGHLTKPFDPLNIGPQVEKILGLSPTERRGDAGMDKLNAEIARVVRPKK